MTKMNFAGCIADIQYMLPANDKFNNQYEDILIKV